MQRALVLITFGLTLLVVSQGALSEEVSCPTPEVSVKSQTPLDLYRAMVACAKQAKYEAATQFFALAGVYGRFDTYRVADVTAHSAPGLLKNGALDAIPQPNHDEWQKVAMSVASDPEKHAALCKKISALGPPTYEPTYMRAHGLNSILGEPDKAPEPAGKFDSQAAWTKALSSYLNCQTG